MKGNLDKSNKNKKMIKEIEIEFNEIKNMKEK